MSQTFMNINKILRKKTLESIILNMQKSSIEIWNQKKILLCSREVFSSEFFPKEKNRIWWVFKTIIIRFWDFWECTIWFHMMCDNIWCIEWDISIVIVTNIYQPQCQSHFVQWVDVYTYSEKTSDFFHYIRV